MDPRAARAGLALGILGGAFALWWAAVGAGGGSSATPLTTYAAAAAWGAAIGGAVGALAGASPSRTTLPLGIGALVGAAGAIGGIAVGVHLLGHDLLDGDQNVLMTSAFVGAGIGWSVGAASGTIVGRETPALGPSQVRMARAAAVAIVLMGVVIAAALGPGIDLASHLRRSTRVMQAAAITDAVLVAVTLAIVGGTHPRREAETSLPTRVVAAGGLVLGCLVFIAFLARIPGAEISRDTRRLTAANARTAWSLAEAGTAYAERTGTIPSSIEILERAGGDVMPGSHVNGLWEMPRGFCVEVGIGVGGGGASAIRSEAVWFVEMASGELRTKVSAGGIGGCEAMIAEGP